jgi:5,10-methylenetetrahydrofolate reductase
MRITELTKRHSFVRLVEFFPPSVPAEPRAGEPAVDLRARVQSLIEKARRVESASDAVIIAQPKDTSRYHLPSLPSAVEVKRSTGIEAIPTIPLRDYNRNALRGLVLYGLYAGLENFCIVRGDPFLPEEAGYSRNAFDLRRVSDAAGLVKGVANTVHNEGVCVLGPLDISGRLDEEYIEVVREREERGVDVFICQPFFGSVEEVLERVDRLRAAHVTRPIIHNVFPLMSEEDAIRMERKFGWQVSPQVKEVLREGGLQAGLRLARDRYYSFLDNRGEVDGVYISSRGHADWAVAILT